MTTGKEGQLFKELSKEKNKHVTHLLLLNPLPLQPDVPVVPCCDQSLAAAAKYQYGTSLLPVCRQRQAGEFYR